MSDICTPTHCQCQHCREERRLTLAARQANQRVVELERERDGLRKELTQLRTELAVPRGHNINNDEHPIHPYYGPCDGFAPGGECAECLEVIQGLRADLHLSAHEREVALREYEQLLASHTAQTRVIDGMQADLRDALKDRDQARADVARIGNAYTRVNGEKSAIMADLSAALFSNARFRHALKTLADRYTHDLARAHVHVRWWQKVARTYRDQVEDGRDAQKLQLAYASMRHVRDLAGRYWQMSGEGSDLDAKNACDRALDMYDENERLVDSRTRLLRAVTVLWGMYRGAWTSLLQVLAQRDAAKERAVVLHSALLLAIDAIGSDMRYVSSDAERFILETAGLPYPAKVEGSSVAAVALLRHLRDGEEGVIP